MPNSSNILLALIVFALSLAGCQSAETPIRIMPGIKATDQNASQATFNHPISRLDYDLWRAAKVDGWAMPYPIKPDGDGHYRGKGQHAYLGGCLFMKELYLFRAYRRHEAKPKHLEVS